MPLPVRRNERRLRPWRRAARSLMSANRASYSFCSADCGGGINSSFEAIRDGIGRGASRSASISHWRTHMVLLLERSCPELRHQANEDTRSIELPQSSAEINRPGAPAEKFGLCCPYHTGLPES